LSIAVRTTIADIRVTLFRVPLREAWVSAAHAITHHEHILVDIELESGLVGTGWASTMGTGGLAVAALANSYLAPMCIGRDAFDHAALWAQLWRRCHQPGSAGIGALAIAGFDLALWDLRGKLAGLPVRRLLGGAADSLPVYVSGVNLHLSETALVEQTRRFLDAGNTLFKIKVGREDPAEDISRVAAVRAAIGNRPLMLDANQRFKPGEALRRINMLERFDPVWIEEPMLSEDADSHARLAAQSRVPIALGEELSTRYEFWRYVSAGAVSYLQPNALKVGGISEWLKIAHLGLAANLTIAPHGALEVSSIVATAIPGCYPVENIDGGAFTDQGILEEPIPVHGGTIALPDRPGLGISFDRQALARHETGTDVRVEPVDPARFFGDDG
jgi:L-alanine-DL-glutamate epimerase-like enolase superfamily enzyme